MKKVVKYGGQPHLYEMILASHPELSFGLQVMIEMDDYKKWVIARAKKARIKKGRRSKWQRR